MNRAHLYYIASVILAMLIVCVPRLLFRYWDKPDRMTITCTIDSQLSCALTKELERCSIVTFQNSDAVLATKRVQNVYPCVESIVYRRSAPYTAHISIKAHDPYIRCNDSMIMTAGGVLIAIDQYIPEAYQHLPTITISDQYCVPLLSHAICTLIKEVPDELFHRFTIQWHSDHHLLLYDKKYQQNCIICDTHCAPTLLMGDLSEKMALMQEQSSTKKNKNTQIVDCRFAGQIVVYDDIRRYDHGKDVR